MLKFRWVMALLAAGTTQGCYFNATCNIQDRFGCNQNASLTCTTGVTGTNSYYEGRCLLSISAPCARNEQCETYRCLRGKCARHSECKPNEVGMCVRYRGNNPPCSADGYCLLDDGESCWHDAECTSGICSATPDRAGLCIPKTCNTTAQAAPMVAVRDLCEDIDFGYYCKNGTCARKSDINCTGGGRNYLNHTVCEAVTSSCYENVARNGFFCTPRYSELGSPCSERGAFPGRCITRTCRMPNTAVQTAVCSLPFSCNQQADCLSPRHVCDSDIYRCRLRAGERCRTMTDCMDDQACDFTTGECVDLSRSLGGPNQYQQYGRLTTISIIVVPVILGCVFIADGVRRKYKIGLKKIRGNAPPNYEPPADFQSTSGLVEYPPDYAQMLRIETECLGGGGGGGGGGVSSSSRSDSSIGSRESQRSVDPWIVTPHFWVRKELLLLEAEHEKSG